MLIRGGHLSRPSLDRALAQVVLPWPEGAAFVQVGDQRRLPRLQEGGDIAPGVGAEHQARARHQRPEPIECLRQAVNAVAFTAQYLERVVEASNVTVSRPCPLSVTRC